MDIDYIIKQSGTFISCHPDKTTKQNIEEFVKLNKVPNAIDKSKLHCTIAHTYTNAMAVHDKHCDINADVIDVRLWELPDKGYGVKYALVLLVDSVDLSNRYQDLKDYGVECRYKEFIPHITLSMDVPKNFTTSIFKHSKIRFIKEECKQCKGD